MLPTSANHKLIVKIIISEIYWYIQLVRRTGCQDTVDECSSLKARDCYNGYYATTCCKSCQALVQNPSDETCLYGDKGIGCSEMETSVCHLSTQFCCQTCAAYLPSASITDTSSVTSIESTVRLGSCPHGDFEGILEIASVWGEIKYANCKELLEHDSSLCKNDTVQKYCCASCGNVKTKGG